MSLVLSRKIGEKIHIGPDVTITVVEVRGRNGQVRLAIDAPRSRRIYRDELVPADPREAERMLREWEGE